MLLGVHLHMVIPHAAKHVVWLRNMCAGRKSEKEGKSFFFSKMWNIDFFQLVKRVDTFCRESYMSGLLAGIIICTSAPIP